jgi:predicted DNA repair protein MutK
MTVGVYGLVAGILKLDDFGLYLRLKKAKVFIANYSAKLAKSYWQ